MSNQPVTWYEMYCPLFHAFDRQIYCCSVIGAKSRALLVYRRIDEVAARVSKDCDLSVTLLYETPLQRASLLGVLAPLYDRFDSFLVEWMPNAYEIRFGGGSQLDCRDATMEWHFLHEHLVVHGFTMKVVEEYIRGLTGLDEVEILERYWKNAAQRLYCAWSPTRLDPGAFPLTNRVYGYF